MTYGEQKILDFCRKMGWDFNKKQISEIFYHNINFPTTEKGILQTMQDLSIMSRGDWLRGIDYPYLIHCAERYNILIGNETKGSEDYFIKNTKMVESCNHEWVDYVGFTHSFQYCKKCDEKKNGREM